ncbi:uncharacterized protein Pyn_40740 [Prunus yedoensis var. nudiflora]|uniref:Uncharacterized protein n=1 Tax=Prunus yedoensis var. nudiflora TaxID=2094558 RepID=A0A314XU58_PRUYE|nr:uncharacterized protein Pyn_40740 [Prunus yedoensis var. nudiflora]
MGIWDFISGTTDSLKRNAPDLMAVKNWCPTPGSLKRIVPDVTAAKNVCSTAYGYGSATVAHIDSAVRGNLNHYLQDEEVRSKILQLGKSIVTHATIEGLKTIPGGFVGYNIFKKSIKDLKDSDKQEVDVKALQADVCRLKKDFSDYKKVHEPEVDVKALQADLLRLEKELSKYRKLHEQVPIDKPSAELKSPNTVNIHSAVYQKPEDVIRVFMMNEFMGRKFLDDLMVPSVAPRKK